MQFNKNNYSISIKCILEPLTFQIFVNFQNYFKIFMDLCQTMHCNDPCDFKQIEFLTEFLSANSASLHEFYPM